MGLFSSTPNCKHCNSSDVKQVREDNGPGGTMDTDYKYRCRDCGGSWWET